MHNLRIAIVGSGNVAWHLATIFNEKNISVTEVYSRNTKNAQEIASISHAKQIKSLSKLGTNADIIILAVSDDSIPEISKNLNCEDKIVCHTSGIANTEHLAKSTKKYACFYPLQTFTKGISVDFSNIPILITASNSETLSHLKTLAFKLSQKVEEITDVERQKLHLAAVIVNNFSNHLYTLSSHYLAENDIDFDLLKPLIQETVNKISSSNPMANQTGPAKRNDKETIEKHFNLMENEDLKDIYKILTKSIYNTHNE